MREAFFKKKKIWFLATIYNYNEKGGNARTNDLQTSAAIMSKAAVQPLSLLI